MDTIARAAFLNAQAACAMVDAMRMLSANQVSVAKGGDVKYGEDEFEALIGRYGIGHNDAISYLRD